MDGGGHLLVGRREEAASRNLRGKPVCLCEPDGEGDEVFLDLLGRKLLADLVQRLDGLSMVYGLDKLGRRRQIRNGWTDLVSDDGLLDGSKVFEGGQQNVSPLGPTDILDEAAKLLAQCNKHFIFILDRLCCTRVSRL